MEPAASTLTELTRLTLDPLLPAGWTIAALALLIAATLALSLSTGRRDWTAQGLRWALALLLAGLLLQPSITQEERRKLPDTVFVVADYSPSQELGERAARRDTTLEHLRAEIAALPGLELEILRTRGAETRTEAFNALEEAARDIPLSRIAGFIFLTDGQVHDYRPEMNERFAGAGPAHVLLTGRHNERDRRLVLEQAPAYAIVGQKAEIRVKIADSAAREGATAPIRVYYDGEQVAVRDVPVGRTESFQFEIPRSGSSVFFFETDVPENDIAPANNRMAVEVNGVRDRLKVLLVSGLPHNGGRVWRNILTSDASVDLVHFTILRPPHKRDTTPIDELSLIAFPVRELFEIKIDDFDLIIFDRYIRRNILPPHYFTNIADFVEAGGALLVAAGPEFARPDSIYSTALSRVLPARPVLDGVHRQAFRPELTEKGRIHPVTAPLESDEQEWGAWLHQLDLQPGSGDILMRGARDQPLLILDRAGEGRVAQLASDQIWLWARGYDGGGPHSPLLRRTAHWLMKEPDLSENALEARAANDRLQITRRSLQPGESFELNINRPDGTSETRRMEIGPDGTGTITVPAPDTGVYTVTDGTHTATAVMGRPDSPEWREVRTDPETLKPFADSLGGKIHWLADAPAPGIRILPENRRFYGRSWLGLRAGKASQTTGRTTAPLIPAWVLMGLILACAVAMWWREGRGARLSRAQ